MIIRDVPEAMLADGAGHPAPWCEEEFRAHLRQRNCIGMVAEDWQESVQGFMMYTLHKRTTRLLRLAVRPEYQRAGVGSALLRKLCSKLCSWRRGSVTIEVDGHNLTAALFLRANGFRCVSLTQRDGQDVYLFRYLAGGMS